MNKSQPDLTRGWICRFCNKDTNEWTWTLQSFNQIIILRMGLTFFLATGYHAKVHQGENMTATWVKSTFHGVRFCCSVVAALLVCPYIVTLSPIRCAKEMIVFHVSRFFYLICPYAHNVRNNWTKVFDLSIFVLLT